MDQPGPLGSFTAFALQNVHSPWMICVFEGGEPLVSDERVTRTSARTLLEELITRSKKTYTEVAQEFGTVALRVGSKATMTPRHLRRLATGGRQGTSTCTARVLEKQFGHSINQLLAPPFHAPCNELMSIQQTPSPIHPLQLTSEELVHMAAQQARNFTLFSPSPLPDEVVAQVRQDVQQLCVSYPQLPLAQIVCDLTQTQSAVFALLEQKHRPADARELYLLAGVVSGLLAKASHDMADPFSAQTQARAAFTAAELADHNGLRAWIRGLQALVAYWAGRYTDSVKYAQEGQRYNASGTAGAWLPISEARAWAVLNNTEMTHECIARAEQSWDGVVADELDELGGICHFSRSRHQYYTADALAWLPEQAKDAQVQAEIAVQAYADRSHPDWAFGDEAGSQTDLAIARITLRDLEGGQAALEPVLSLPVELRINGIVRSVNHAERALAAAFPGDNPQVRALREELDAFTRVTTAGAPR